MADARQRSHRSSPGGAKPPFPPFNAETFASQLFWLVISFVLLYLLMSRVALPRVGRIIDGARRGIAGDLAEAQRLKDETDAAIAGYEKKLADARANAQSIASQTRDKLMAEGREAPQGARGQAQRQACRGRKDHRRDQDGGDGQCPRHRHRCRGRDRRAADRHASRTTRRSRPPSVRRAEALEDHGDALRSRILGRGRLRHVRRRARLCRRAQARSSRRSTTARDRIKAELDEARRLKDEAKALLAEYQQKQRGRRERGRSDHRERQGRCRAARRRGQGQARGIRRPPHQDGGDQDRPGRGPGAGRRAQLRRRGRRRRRRKDADPARPRATWPSS